MPKYYKFHIFRYASSARGECDIMSDPQRIMFRNRKNFEFINKLDHRVEEENNNKIAIDFKSKKSLF